MRCKSISKHGVYLPTRKCLNAVIDKIRAIYGYVLFLSISAALSICLFLAILAYKIIHFICFIISYVWFYLRFFV